MDYREAAAHAGKMLCLGALGLSDVAHEAMPGYIWFWGDPKHRKGWCSKCGSYVDLQDPIGWYDDLYEMECDCNLIGHKEWQTPYFEGRRSTKAQHKSTGVCPACWARVEFRRESTSRKCMVDRKLLIRYGRSAIQENAWVCVGYLVTNDWSGNVDPRQVCEHIQPVELCVFRYGKGAHRFIARWDSDAGGMVWKKRKECISGWAPGQSWGTNGMTVIRDENSWRDAVEDTCISYAIQTLEGWHIDAAQWYDRITLMAKVTAYPQIEYMLRTGLHQLVREVVSGNTGKLLNMRGKTAQKVLRLDGNEWGEVKGKRLNLDLGALKVHRLAQSRRLRISMEQCLQISRSGAGWYTFRDLCREMPWMDMQRVLRYCRKKQIGLNDYLDYARQLVRQEIAHNDYERLYPQDFHAAHQREMERMEVQKNSRYDADIAKLQKQLEGRYTFRACGLELRPFANAAEVVREGNVQHICIGSYVARYAKGDTILCALRRVGDPHRPWHAVEFTKDGRLVQCRGERNMTDEEDERIVRMFWAAWDAWHHTETNVSLRIKRRTDAA